MRHADTTDDATGIWRCAWCWQEQPRTARMLFYKGDIRNGVLTGEDPICAHCAEVRRQRVVMPNGDII